ncbi:MAG: glycoside hydrolase family 3 C-terminal domain-containing protein [Prolixibacteraceae bacterium]|jgi:beta-glucosidase|nr:glycoside hydrolase family 3 C-terminal domain-containing protein [Prolixibacteraceae bacterium]
MSNNKLPLTKNSEFTPFTTPVDPDLAFSRADSIVKAMTIDERIEMIGGHNFFFVHEVESANLPRLYLSDATQGVHLRKDLDSQLEKSVAMPCPIMLTSTWNRDLAQEFAKSIGEECRAGDIAVLLGPGMNIYRIAQNGRNFEYFGEDPFLAARLIENYIVGVQSTGTIGTLKHFIANNSDYRRRTSNSIVSERAIHELYLPAFKAGVDAGAMAVMTSYNQLNGEWCGQSEYAITELLRGDLGFKWLVMSDWWSVWDPVKGIKSGLDLDMPGEGIKDWAMFDKFGDSFLRTNAKRLLDAGDVSEDDINRMSRNIIATQLAMGLDKRAVKDESYLNKFDQHEQVALQTAREGIVLLKNKNNILPITNDSLSILATGRIMELRMSGGGSADVEGYNWVKMVDGLKEQFGKQLTYIAEPSNEELQAADIVLCATGTFDSEGWDKAFELPAEETERIKNIVAQNSNVVMIVNSGSGIEMTSWNDKVAGLLYSWYPGQMGNKALAEVIAGKVCPSGKLPITIEKKFEDSPGYPYIPEGEKLYVSWDVDSDMSKEVYDNVYDEGVFVGYRWYEAKNIEPLYAFGTGLSYTTFAYDKIKLSTPKLQKGETLKVQFTIENTGSVEGAEIAQLYIQDIESTVDRPLKELKDFIKVVLQPGEKKRIELKVTQADLSFYSEELSDWLAENGEFKVLIGTASNNIKLEKTFRLID